MAAIIVSLLSGMIFSLGLVLSGMTNPKKVIGFLDIFGSWDFTLALVMAGAVGFNVIVYTILKTKNPVLSKEKFLPTKTEIDKGIVIGSTLFGIGWGILGICPGPSIVNLVFLNKTSITFVISMLIGIWTLKSIQNKRS